MGAARVISESITEAGLIKEISEIISGITGVQLGEKQYALVQGRLSKRMRELRVTTPGQYAKYLNANQAVEIGALTSLLTTHHTYFFREFSHFEFLLKNTLPALIQSHRKKGLNTIRIWSAACSRGQEVYSLAMFLNYHLPTLAPDMKFEILGSDVCEESISLARNGVYTWEEVKSIPSAYLQGNWSRGTGEIAAYVRAKESLRSYCEFKPMNLVELHKAPFGHGKNPPFDIIFCRNVFIYFTHQQIKDITRQFLKLLNPDGQLFVGLSESLNGLDLPVEWVGPSIYRPLGEGEKAKVLPFSTTSKASATLEKSGHSVPGRSPAPAPAAALRVLCVDDSPTILTLLKKLLTKEKGFEIVGTAANGEEAAEKAKLLKPDVITLDIHMPVASGIDYLEKYHRQVRVPVVIVSSVSRDDSNLAFRALELGASDYIEKPSLQNMVKIEEELLFKLRAASELALKAGQKPVGPTSLDASFKRAPAITNTQGKLRVIMADFSSREPLMKLANEFRGTQPPTLILMNGAGEIFQEWAQKAAKKLRGASADTVSSVEILKENSIVIMELSKGLELLKKARPSLDISIVALGPYSKPVLSAMKLFPRAYTIAEDLGDKTPSEVVSRAEQVVPLTSFHYESDRYFADGRTSK